MAPESPWFNDAQAWDRLITAHEASEIALAGRQAQAPA